MATNYYSTHAEWLRDRTTGIGSSDIATIVGLNEYETPYSLWRSKLGLDPAKEETLPMHLGHLLEPTVARLYAEQTGAVIAPESEGEFVVFDDDSPWLRVSPDRYATRPDGTTEIVECKTTQRTIDPDDLPAYWLMQVQYQMGVTGIHAASLAWLSAGRDFGTAQVDFVPEVYDYLKAEATCFWLHNVIGRKEPEPVAASDILAKYGTGTKGKEREADEEIRAAVRQVTALREQIADLETAKTELEERIKVAMEDATELVYNGKTLATWRGSKPSKTFDRKRFEAEHPDLAAEYITESPGSRRFILK